jgi:sugar lactone lactonase YvrE
VKNVLQVSALMLLLSALPASAQLGPYTSGFIYTVAGDGYGAGLGFGGFSGDGKPAIFAELNWPLSETLNGAGNLYIADSQNNRIRKVDATTGIITTFAGDGIKGYSGDGGPAIDAELDLTEGIYWDATLVADAAGNIYISDQGNNRVRKVDAATGVITTYAGNGSQETSGDGRLATAAGIPAPGGLAIDASGDLYITEVNEVYEVNGDFSYLISEFNVVRKVDAATGIVTTVAGNGIHGTSGDGGPATSAELGGPFQVALDGAGNLYIEEVDYPRVRKVDATTGIITTVAGNGSQGLTGSGVAATSTGFLLPVGLAVDAPGNIYISDDSGDRVWRVDVVTGIIEPYAGNGLCTPDNDFAACFTGDGGPALNAGIYGPYGLSLDAAGNLYFADSANQRVRVVGSEANAATTTTTLTASAVELNYGQPLTLTATVKAAIGGTISGTVSFLSGKTLLGSADLNDGGVATLTLTPDGGSYSIIAVYDGSPKYQGSASYPPIEVTVDPAPTTTALTASPNPAYWGNTVIFTATAGSSMFAPTGSVSFYDGTILLATEPLKSSVATYSTMVLSVGSHNITAVYVSTADFSSSTSNIVVEVINPADFSISASPGSQNVYTGLAADYTVTIAPGTGFAVPVTLSCTQLPANSTCTFSPTTVNGGPWSSTLMVQTTPPAAATAASISSAKFRAAALAGLFPLIIPRRLRRYRKGWPLLFVIIAILAAGAAITGCSSPGPLADATPVGAQTITVTGIATNGVQTLTHSVNVTLNVNSLF